MKKRWYDSLWIASLLYLVLGFFNILFAWLGLLCFFIPLVIAFAGGDKGYCNRFCGRGQLFSLLGGRFGLSRRADIPRWMKSKAFRYGFLGFFLLMFFQMLWSTYLVFAGAQELRRPSLCFGRSGCLGTGPTMEPSFPPAWPNSPLAFTASCSPLRCWGWSQWCFSNPAHGVCIALWAP